MKDRIKQYIEYKGIPAGELALKLDVQRSNISHILNGRNKPGAAFIEKLLLVFPDINARWLLTGKGEMIETERNKEDSSIQEVPVALPISPANTREKLETKPEEVKPLKEERPPRKKPADGVAKMILLYNDGTFETFQNRDKDK